MQVIKYYQSENQAHWREEIGKGDWSAAELLHDWLKNDKLKQMCGDSTEVYMLTDGDKLVSFATLAPQDEIDAPKLTPWIGFVYTFPAYRGHRNAGKLIAHICEVLKSAGTEKVYISTDEIGLYEKYGFTFWQTMPNREGKPTRVYVNHLQLLSFKNTKRTGSSHFRTKGPRNPGFPLKRAIYTTIKTEKAVFITAFSVLKNEVNGLEHARKRVW